MEKVIAKMRNVGSMECPKCRAEYDKDPEAYEARYHAPVPTINGAHVVKKNNPMQPLSALGYPDSAYGGKIQGVKKVFCPNCMVHYFGFLTRKRNKSEYTFIDMAPVKDLQVVEVEHEVKQSTTSSKPQYEKLNKDSLPDLDEYFALTTEKRQALLDYNAKKAMAKQLGMEVPKTVKQPDLDDMIEHYIRLQDVGNDEML